MLYLRHSLLRAVDVSGQLHVVLEVVKIVTNQLGNDSILFHHLLLHLYHLRPRRAELLFQGLNPTELFGLHDHRVICMVHRVVGLERRSDQLMPIMDPQFNLTINWTSTIK